MKIFGWDIPKIRDLSVYMVRKSERNKNFKHDNLNESALTKQQYVSSSEEESFAEETTKNASTSTEHEKFCQTETRLSTNSWRNKEEIQSDIEKSSDPFEEADDEEEDDGIEVEKTDLEIQLEENLKILSLTSSNLNREETRKKRLHIFGENPLEKTISTPNLSSRPKVIIEKKVISCTNLSTLIDTSRRINQKRQLTLLEKTGDLLGEPGDYLSPVHPGDFNYQSVYSPIEPLQITQKDIFSPIEKNKFTYENAVDILSKSERKILRTETLQYQEKTHLFNDSCTFERNRDIRGIKVTKQAFSNYQDFLKLGFAHNEIRKSATELKTYIHEDLKLTEENHQ